MKMFWDREGATVTKIISHQKTTEFQLSDGSNFTLGVAVEQLEQLLKLNLRSENSHNYETDLFIEKFTMTEELWKEISSILLHSQIFLRVMKKHPRLLKLLYCDIFTLRQLPLQVYGGSRRSALYASYPCHFAARPGQSEGIYRNIFFEEPNLVMVTITPLNRRIEVEEGIKPRERIGTFSLSIHTG